MDSHSSTPQLAAFRLQLYATALQFHKLIDAFDAVAPSLATLDRDATHPKLPAPEGQDHKPIDAFDCVAPLLVAPSRDTAITKLPAPEGENRTSSPAWRKHIKALHSELIKEFGRQEFRGKQLRPFLEARVQLLPGDLRIYEKTNGRVLVWHQAVYDAISCRAHTWGEGGAPIVCVGRDRWQVVHPAP